jgi:hypothetical protein
MASLMKIIRKKFAESTSLKDVKHIIKRQKEGIPQRNFFRYAEEALIQKLLSDGKTVQELIALTSDATNSFDKPWTEKRLTKMATFTAKNKEKAEKAAAREKAKADKKAAREAKKTDRQAKKDTKKKEREEKKAAKKAAKEAAKAAKVKPAEEAPAPAAPATPAPAAEAPAAATTIQRKKI